MEREFDDLFVLAALTYVIRHAIIRHLITLSLCLCHYLINFVFDLVILHYSFLLLFCLLIVYLFRLKQQLLPSLICSCYKNDHNLSIIRQEISTTILADLLKKALMEKRQLDVHSTVNSCGDTYSEHLSTVSAASRQFLQAFSLRFPVEFWSDALQYFSVNESHGSK